MSSRMGGALWLVRESDDKAGAAKVEQQAHLLLFPRLLLVSLSLLFLLHQLDGFN